MRAFIALPVPSWLKDELGHCQNQLQSSLPPATLRATRWVKPAQIHLTLCFLGEISAEVAELVGEEIQAACSGLSPISLHLAELGAFPSLRRARVLYAGLDGDLVQLRALQQQIQQHVARHCPQMDNKPFHPHLTLVRFKPQRQQNIDISAYRVLQMSIRKVWQADVVQLLRSDLKSSGAEYSVLTEVALNP